MKRLITLALAVVVAVSLVGCVTVDEPSSDTIAMPASSGDLKGENYNDVMTRLKTAGFASIETTTIPDLVLGWLTKDGEVERVSVDGQTDFDSGTRFSKDTTIVITYHTFPKDEPEKAAEGDPKEEPEPAAESDPVVTAPKSDTQKKVSDTIKASNNKAFWKLMTTMGPKASVVRAFAKKYDGRTIEFEGFTLGATKHKGKTTKTLYDMDIKVGDYYQEGFLLGPAFRAEGFSVPKSSRVRDYRDVHVRAKIKGYSKSHEAIMLTIISIEKRASSTPKPW